MKWMGGGGGEEGTCACLGQSPWPLKGRLNCKQNCNNGNANNSNSQFMPSSPTTMWMADLAARRQKQNGAQRHSKKACQSGPSLSICVAPLQRALPLVIPHLLDGLSVPAVPVAQCQVEEAKDCQHFEESQSIQCCYCPSWPNNQISGAFVKCRQKANSRHPKPPSPSPAAAFFGSLAEDFPAAITATNRVFLKGPNQPTTIWPYFLLFLLLPSSSFSSSNLVSFSRSPSLCRLSYIIITYLIYFNR
jgi:hypothetical protein